MPEVLEKNLNMPKIGFI